MPGVERWDIITIGNLSRNRYWGEGDERAVRPALCTCTLITGDGFRLVVDPSMADAERMAAELDRRTGRLQAASQQPPLTTKRIVEMRGPNTAHGDHLAGIGCFDRATWLAAPDVAADGDRLEA